MTYGGFVGLALCELLGVVLQVDLHQVPDPSHQDLGAGDPLLVGGPRQSLQGGRAPLADRLVLIFDGHALTDRVPTQQLRQGLQVLDHVNNVVQGDTQLEEII